MESRLRLIYGSAEVWVPREGLLLRRLARSLGDASPEGGERLLRELDRLMARTRQTTLELFEGLGARG